MSFTKLLPDFRKRDMSVRGVAEPKENHTCTLGEKQKCPLRARGNASGQLLKRLQLQHLPGEIRNRIYEYVYAVERTVIFRPKSSISKNHPLSHLFINKSSSPKAHRVLCIRTRQAPGPNKALQYFNIPGGRTMPYTGVEYETSPISLLLTCKSIGDEAAGFLYANTQFFFEDPSRLNAFMKTVKPKNLCQITKLRLFIQAYGIPCGRDDTQWEHKHLSRWVDTLNAVVRSMPRVTFLTLDLHLANVASFLGRAFRSCSRDLGPLTLPSCLSRLEHLKKASVRTSSQLLICASDPSLMSEMYGPHFEVQGIYHPSTIQMEAVYMANKMQADDLHDALNLAIKKMIGAGFHGKKKIDDETRLSKDDGDDWLVELSTAVKQWQQWNKNPVGNALRAAGPLPAPGPVHVVQVAHLPTPPNNGSIPTLPGTGATDNNGLNHLAASAPVPATNQQAVPVATRTRKKKKKVPKRTGLQETELDESPSEAVVVAMTPYTGPSTCQASSAALTTRTVSSTGSVNQQTPAGGTSIPKQNGKKYGKRSRRSKQPKEQTNVQLNLSPQATPFIAEPTMGNATAESPITRINPKKSIGNRRTCAPKKTDGQSRAGNTEQSYNTPFEKKTGRGLGGKSGPRRGRGYQGEQRKVEEEAKIDPGLIEYFL